MSNQAGSSGYTAPPSNSNKNKKKNNKTMYNVLLIFFVFFFVVSLALLGYQLLDYYKADKTLNEKRSLLGTQATEEQLSRVPHEFRDSRLVPLFAEYEDFRGWITIPGTNVDHPVVQSTDNAYYLERDMDGNFLRLGTVFADYRNNFDESGLSMNTILYGHNGKNRTYFHDVLKYKDPAFYASNPFLTFETMFDNPDWVVVGAFLASIHADQDREPVFEYYQFLNGTEQEHNDFMAQVRRRSYFTTDVPVDPTDKLLTLSTCDYEFDDPRFVLVARQLRPGETKENMQINSSKNQNQYMADAWYAAKGIANPK